MLARVAKVPEFGSVKEVLAETVKLVVNKPENVTFPPIVIVLEPLLTPVPPFADGSTPVTPAVSET
jgi:hypothetical protein